MRWKKAVETASVVIWPFESAAIVRSTLRQGEWFSRQVLRKLGFTALEEQRLARLPLNKD